MDAYQVPYLVMEEEEILYDHVEGQAVCSAEYNSYNNNNVITLISFRDDTISMSEAVSVTDRRTLYLLSKGDIPAWMSQEVYEYAWEQGIRPLNEMELKPDLITGTVLKGHEESMDIEAFTIDGGSFI